MQTYLLEFTRCELERNLAYRAEEVVLGSGSEEADTRWLLAASRVLRSVDASDSLGMLSKSGLIIQAREAGIDLESETVRHSA